ncbi:esterase/lipase family protein [Pseudonocardia spinosispora]|uniref:esterase/lipase family protein n=1 Tax=Pseudonocardia spinosispora TaxID=103441 RepID=UPI0003F66C76|nr:alpha/beta fold hydrolase [Pseudonocardia spinosispora]
MSVPDDEGCASRESVARTPDSRHAHAADVPVPRSSLRAIGTLAAAAATNTFRTLRTPSGLRGAAVETAWCAARLASYPLELIREQTGAHEHYRTDTLSPVERGLVMSDMTAAGTPVLLVHGMLDNRSVFSSYRRQLRQRGFGALDAVNYSAFTNDIRAAAHDLRSHINRLRTRTGAERIHVIGHSVGGLIARYHVQRLRGDHAVHTLVTIGTPHAGSAAAHLLPTPLARQLVPGSELLTELAGPAPDCRTRFLVVSSRMDQFIVPSSHARLEHPDLAVRWTTSVTCHSPFIPARCTG